MSTTVQSHAHLCDCCEERPVVGVAASPLGPISHGYCRRCLQLGIEPIETIVATLWCCGASTLQDVIPEVADIVRKSLEFYELSEDELWERVRQYEDPSPSDGWVPIMDGTT